MGKSQRAFASWVDPRSQTVLEALEKKIRKQPDGKWEVPTYSDMNKELGLKARGFSSRDVRILVLGLNTRHKIILVDNREGVITVQLPYLVSDELRTALKRELLARGGHLQLSGLTKLRNNLNVTGLENKKLQTALEQLRDAREIDFTVSPGGEVDIRQKSL